MQPLYDPDAEDAESAFWGSFWNAARVATTFASLTAIGAAVDSALTLLPELDGTLTSEQTGLQPMIDPATFGYLRENLEAARRHVENVMEPLRAIVGHKTKGLRDPAKVKAKAFHTALLRGLAKAGFDAPARTRWLRAYEEGAGAEDRAVDPSQLRTSESRRRNTGQYVREEDKEAIAFRKALERRVDLELATEAKSLRGMFGARARTVIEKLMAVRRARHLGEM